MLWVCVLLPQLALDEVLRRTEDTVSPLVIVEGPSQRRIIREANVTAKKAGLYPGQALAAARAIVSDFRCIDYQPQAEQGLRQWLAAWAYTYSSKVSLRESDALLMEIDASLALFGPWMQIEHRLRTDLTEHGITHRIALAPTPLAACVLAGIKDGEAVCDIDSLGKKLGVILLEQSRLPKSQVEALRAMGLRRLRELFALPRSSLTRRTDTALLSYLDRLRGVVADPLDLYCPPDCFACRMEFDCEISSNETLLFPLRRLLKDLAIYLQSRDAGVQEFAVELEHENHPATVLAIGPMTQQRDAAILFDIARLKLQSAAVLKAVRAMRLVAAQLASFVPMEPVLFEQRPGAQLSWFDIADRLRARLGMESVHELSCVADHRPERAWRRSTVSSGTLATEIGQRPTWLLPEPVPLQQNPQRILAGPERIESGWWDSQDVQRDYYVVETQQGQWAWVFRTVGQNNPWMLHGWFA